MYPATPDTEQTVFFAGGKKSDRKIDGLVFSIFAGNLILMERVNKRTEMKASMRIEEMDSGGRRKGMKAFLGIEVVGSDEPGKEHEQMDGDQAPNRDRHASSHSHHCILMR